MVEMPMEPARNRALVTFSALRFAYICGVLPLLMGSAAFAWWWISPSNAPVILGIASIVLGLVLFLLGIGLLVRVVATKPRPSAYASLGALTLLLASFPIAYAYHQLVLWKVTTNRYLFVNKTNAAIEDLVVFHRNRQIGFCERLTVDDRVEFCFSALDNGGEGAISFNARQRQEEIGGDTGLMAFVFTKSHGIVTVYPNNNYHVEIQNFRDGIPFGAPDERFWKNDEDRRPVHQIEQTKPAILTAGAVHAMHHNCIRQESLARVADKIESLIMHLPDPPGDE